MSEPQSVLIERATPVWTITLNLAHKRNALNLSDRIALIEALREAESDNRCVAVVLTGAGPTFCAGGDIASMTSDPEAARVRLAVLADLTNALVRNKKPIIAAVNGGAFGLGLSLAAASDYIVAGRDARFVASFGKLGLVADTGLFWSLSQRVGASRAKVLILWGTELSADEAHRIGLVNECTEPGQELDRALEVGACFVDMSPPMVSSTKQIFAQADQGIDAILQAEAEAQLRLLATEEFAERQQAFLDRSKRRDAHHASPETRSRTKAQEQV